MPTHFDDVRFQIIPGVEDHGVVSPDFRIVSLAEKNDGATVCPWIQ
jgi:hypothetical protein